MTRKSPTPLELKMTIVKRIINGELSVKDATKEYGISSPSQVYTWMNKMKANGTLPNKPKGNKELVPVGDNRITALEAELEQARAEISSLRERLIAIEDDADTMHFINMTLGRTMKNGH
jgi:transposase-like protein